MPKFTYRVRDKAGKESRGAQEASSEEELVGWLQNKGLVVVAVTQEQKGRKKKATIRHFHSGVTVDDLILFVRQLATMLDAGVTLLKSLDVLSKQIESKRLYAVTEQLRRDVAGGNSFSDALAKHPRVFSELFVNLISTGEASGALPTVLAQLADHLESTAALRRKVVSAFIYPTVLIVIAAACLIVFTVWIIPIFSKVFESFDLQFPLITKLVLAFSKFIRSYFLVIFVATSTLLYLLYKYIRTEKGRWQFDYLKLKVPVLSSLFQKIVIEKFASALGILIQSGVPLLYGLDIVGKTVGNRPLEQAVKQVRESVRVGRGMAGPLEDSGVFTPMVVQMVSVGEEIGELGKMLTKISEFYKERIATTLTRMTVLVEPVVLVLMGIVVGIMVVSMFLPIFQLALVSKGI